jgi:hypothetical protein
VSFWAVELHAKPATESIGVLGSKLLPKRHKGMLEQLKAPSLGPEAPSMVNKINE